MGDNESDEHLRIFKCLIDTGSLVLRNAIGIKLLNNNSISFVQYLENNKHQFYHQFEKRIWRKCCPGSPHGCVFPGTMDKKIFNKMYNKTAEHNTQDCLDRFETNAGISLDILDLSDLNFFLWNSSTLSAQEKLSLDKIMSIRRAICHPPSSRSYSIVELERYWSALENAVLFFAEPKCYKDIIELQIETLRKSNNVNVKTQLYINDKVNEWKEREKKLEEEAKEAKRQTDECLKSLERQIDNLDEKIKDVTLIPIDKASFVQKKTEFPDYSKQSKQGQKKTGHVTKLVEVDDTTQIIRKTITLDDHSEYSSMPDFLIEALKRSKSKSRQQLEEEYAEKQRMIEKKIGITSYASNGMTAYPSKFEEKVPKEREELAKDKLSKEKQHKKRRKSAGSSKISKGGKTPLLFEPESSGTLNGQDNLNMSYLEVTSQDGTYKFKCDFGIFHNSLIKEITKLEEKIAGQPNSISAEDMKFKDILQKVQMEMDRISVEASTDAQTLPKNRTKRMEEKAKLKRETVQRSRNQLLDTKKREKQLKEEARQRELQKIMMLMDDDERRKRQKEERRQQEEDKKRQGEERRQQEEELQTMFTRMRETSEVGFHIRIEARI